MRRATVSAAISSLLVLCACEDPAPRRERLVEDKSGAPVEWLSPTDARDPSVWLAQHESAAPPGEAEIEAMRKALEAAGARFLESRRMLANRVAQLHGMLSGAGLREALAPLLLDLSRVAAASSKKQTFGELCQHYYNLRRQGQGREAALAALTAAYSAQKRDL